MTDNNGKNNNKLTKGRVIKVIEDLDFGVLETNTDELLFFHISSFDEDLSIHDIKEGDIILCQAEEQSSDGRISAVNCKRVDSKGYLKDYFIENALTAPGDLDLYDEFFENAKDYAAQLKKSDISIDNIYGFTSQIDRAENVLELKKLRPLLGERMAESTNPDLVEFFEILDKLIEKLPKEEMTMEFRNIKSFVKTVASYIQMV